MQSPLTTDPAGLARIGRYPVATQTWSQYRYPLDAGSSVGVSELISLGGTRFAVVERDNPAGPTARVKKLYTVELDSASATDRLPLLQKKLARDLLPDPRRTNGWVQEKVEGVTIGGDGQVYLVTDNDGVEDSAGEGLFTSLGSARWLFGRSS